MKNYRLASAAGISTSVIVASAMALWNWIENPGGIFRTPDGTNWSFVWETFTSWFLPLLLLLVSLLLLVAFVERRFRDSQ